MTDIPRYGTPEWFEKMFTTACEGIDGWGHQWRASQQFRYLLCLRAIQNIVCEHPPQSLLDIGCGLGDFTNMVLSLNHKNKLYGMDISENAVSGANKKYPDIEFKHGALPLITFDGNFDGIISLDCLYYLDEPNRLNAAKNIQMHLKPNGWFVFSTPIDDGSHYFTTRQILEMLERGGFNIQKTIYNHARLYNRVEKPLLKIIDLARIVQEVEANNNDHLSAQKVKLQHLIRAPILGFLLKTTVKFSSAVSGRILQSMLIAHIFQWIGRTLLKNRSISHCIVLSFKNE